MHSLPLFHRIAGQPVIVVGEGDVAAAKARLVERAGGVVVGPDDPYARLAFVALDAPEATAVALKERGVLVNVADRPDLCDFTLPSLLDRDPVLVAVSTGGASAGLAKAVRLRLDGLLPGTLGRLALALEGAREALRKRWPDAADRRRTIDAALGEGGALDPLRDHPEGAVTQWLEGADAPDGAIHEITLTSADPDDLTLRQARLLGMADLILHDAAVSPAVLNRARADAVRQVMAPGEVAPAQSGVVVILRSR